MSRYLIQFYKEGNMRYISHLDLQRLFIRTFKRVGIKLIHSQGFNPHPKMSFVQPLSLGYSSQREYLDFEMLEYLPCESIRLKLNEAMPKGVGVTACRELTPSKKTLAAIVEYAAYEVSMSLSSPMPLKEKILGFLSQEEIIVEKKQKKTGKMVAQNIRPMILEISEKEEAAGNSKAKNDSVDDKYIMLTLLICAGSNRNLNPEVLLSAFCGYCGIPYAAEDVNVTRKELFYVDSSTQELRSVLQYEPSTCESKKGAEEDLQKTEENLQKTMEEKSADNVEK